MKPFLADVHLGRLAKWMRMLGFDVAYSNSYSNAELKAMAEKEGKVLLSRNPAFAKLKDIDTLTITDEDPEKQLQQVLQHFDLKTAIRPFTRCLVCNGILRSVEKSTIINELEENTATYYNEFWQCEQCRKIYWKGSHYGRMMKLIENLN